MYSFNYHNARQRINHGVVPCEDALRLVLDHKEL